MLERDFQGDFVKAIERRIPGCKVVKNDPSNNQGFPDLTVFYKEKYAVIEAKRSEDAKYRPNQEDYIKIFGLYTFAKRAEPENEEEILNGLSDFFGIQ